MAIATLFLFGALRSITSHFVNIGPFSAMIDVMKERVVSAQEIAGLKSPYVKHVSGSLQSTGLSPLPPANMRSGGSVFVSNPDDFQKALASHQGLIFALESLVSGSLAPAEKSAVFSTPSISAAMAVVLPLFDKKPSPFFPGGHATAVIEPSAKLDPSVQGGPYAVIGADTVIGKNTRVSSHVVIENEVSIGANCIFHPQVYVSAQSEIGQRCEIHAHANIGSVGFGYVQGPDKKRNKITQIVIVILENDM